MFSVESEPWKQDYLLNQWAIDNKKLLIFPDIQEMQAPFTPLVSGKMAKVPSADCRIVWV